MRRLALAGCLLGATVVAAPAHAADSACQLDSTPPAASPRVVTATLDGIPYDVLLPAGYAQADRRYPVLYLLHGRQYSEHSWLRKSDIEEFTAGLPASRQAIVVMPSSGGDGWFFDYFDRSRLYERWLFERLIPKVERTYRALRGGDQRAIAGFSAGGMSAAYVASAHPHEFAAVGSLSGLVHLTIPEPPYAGPGNVEPSAGAGSPGEPRGPSKKEEFKPFASGCESGDALGDRTRDAWSWHAHNPSDLARNLRGLGVYIGAGNNVPCGPDDASDPILLAGIEPGILTMTEAYDGALDAAGVPHVFDRYACGLHNMASASRALHRFWDLMTKSFGRGPPAPVGFRSERRDFDVWGWKLRTDPRRAPEFLELVGAGRTGITLIGSGRTTLVTPPIFKPGRRFSVSGARPAIARAGSDRRLTLAVDLGPPSTEPQFSGESEGRNVVARRVRLRALPRPVLPRRRDCSAGSTLRVRMPTLRKGERRVSVAISVNAKRVFVRRGRKARGFRRVTLRDLPRGKLLVRVRVKTEPRRIIRRARHYPPCA